MYTARPKNLTEKEIRQHYVLLDNEKKRLGPGTLGLLLHWWWSMGRVQVEDAQQKPLHWILITTEERTLRDIERMYSVVDYTKELKWDRIFYYLNKSINLIEEMLLDIS